MSNTTLKSVVIIVAHPDDETLWAGGTIMNHPEWKCFIVCLCRANDKERATKFYNALKILNAEGIMGNLDDGIKQKPLTDNEVEAAILNLLPTKSFDIIITHSSTGEYTKHRRHEEIGKAVMLLWETGKIEAPEIWVFAYEDGNKEYYPKAIQEANFSYRLSQKDLEVKYNIITEIYGFKKNSWEAETTPKKEAFWRFKTQSILQQII